MPKRRALIVGGSIGGVFAAALLRSTGWDVTVFECARGNLGDRGAGIGTREELFTVMRRVGVKFDPGIRVDVIGRTGLDRSGATVLEFPVRSITSGWTQIWQPLRDSLPEGCYRSGMTLVRVEQDASSVTARFEDGSSETGDLLLGADGPLSAVRSQFLPELSPTYAGYVAWRGVASPDRIDPQTHPLLLNRMVFGFPDGELMLSVPMPATPGSHEPGRCHFVWFRPMTEPALGTLCDSQGRWNGAWIMQRNLRPAALDMLRRHAEALLAPQLAALVANASQIILQPIYDLESPQIVFGRVALLGDAAFVARPHVATGVMKAALDAERLADALADVEGPLDAALARYDHERRMFGKWLVERGRHIAGYFSATDGDPAVRIRRLMREYGAAGVIADEPITVRLPG